MSHRLFLGYRMLHSSGVEGEVARGPGKRFTNLAQGERPRSGSSDISGCGRPAVSVLAIVACH